MKPRIGITCTPDMQAGSYAIEKEYVNAIAAAGGIPIVVTPISDSPSYAEAVLASVDGIVLSGGGDIDPRIYCDEERHESLRDVNDIRDYFETHLARRAYALDLPVLGVCRGMQVMNVALGGTLIQDLTLIPGMDAASVKLHKQDKPYCKARHEVIIEAGTRLHALYREEGAEAAVGPLPLYVNSMHHQAIDKVASFLNVSARSGEVIEALEGRNGGFYLGVQWHPEYLGNAAPLFRALTNAAERSA